MKKNDYIPFRLEGVMRGANPLLIQLEDAGMLMVCDPGNNFFNEHVFQLFQLQMHLGSQVRSSNTRLKRTNNSVNLSLSIIAKCCSSLAIEYLKCGFKLCSLISVHIHVRSKSIVKIQQS